MTLCGQDQAFTRMTPSILANARCGPGTGVRSRHMIPGVETTHQEAGAIMGLFPVEKGEAWSQGWWAAEPGATLHLSAS